MGCTRSNAKPNVHTDIDLLFADVPNNLRVLRISTSFLDVHAWYKRFVTYFEVLFAFANTNLHNDGIIVFAHAADRDVSRSIHNWAHREDFYIAKYWFSMNNLDLQSPTVSSELISPCILPPPYSCFIPCMIVFRTLPCTFGIDPQVFHKCPRAE